MDDLRTQCARINARHAFATLTGFLQKLCGVNCDWDDLGWIQDCIDDLGQDAKRFSLYICSAAMLLDPREH